MRASVVGVALIVTGLASVSVAPVHAQSPLDGPLAAPGDMPATAATRTPRRPKAGPKTPHHAAAKRAASHDAAETPPVVPAYAPAPAHEAPAEPLSLGMKWNGNNDTAVQTRSQNLDGNATGTGAEVGMKLHF